MSTKESLPVEMRLVATESKKNAFTNASTYDAPCLKFMDDGPENDI